MIRFDSLTESEQEAILFEINIAVFCAMDDAINEQLGMNREAWITDQQLPDLIPAIETAAKAAMRNTGKE